MITNLGYMSLDWRSLGNDGWAQGGEWQRTCGVTSTLAMVYTYPQAERAGG